MKETKFFKGTTNEASKREIIAHGLSKTRSPVGAKHSHGKNSRWEMLEFRSS
jgi:hypothetical protein